MKRSKLRIAVITAWVVVFMATHLLGCARSDMLSQPTGNSADTASVPTSEESRIITLEEFEQIEIGMDAEDAVAILGRPMADVGSGILISMYELDDGNAIYISYKLTQQGDCVVSRITAEVVNG